jgi:hypothetical protein
LYTAIGTRVRIGQKVGRTSRERIVLSIIFGSRHSRISFFAIDRGNAASIDP